MQIAVTCAEVSEESSFASLSWQTSMFFASHYDRRNIFKLIVVIEKQRMKKVIE
jgi:hypothetical protein